MGRACAMILLAAVAARAGGGPETTLVVVNGDSPLSRRVANEYAALRRIPPANLLFLEGIPTLRVVPMEFFRTRMLAPILAHLRERKLDQRIDLVAWSADFPYGVDLRGVLKEGDVGREITPVASLTGLTFFARRIERELYAEAVHLQANRYYRRESGGPPQGGRSATAEERAAFQEAMQALQARDYAKAADAYRRFLATFQHHFESWYNLACCLARLGKADEAMAALRESHERGWRDASKTEQDEDLAPLRKRDDFRALVETMRAGRRELQKSRAFSASLAWDPDGEPEESDDSLDRYYLSVMLAYTGEWGNSAPEALSALRASVGSDGTNPDGTFYFPKNGDVRSTTREPAFEGVVAALRAMGRKAEILAAGVDGQTGVLPMGKADVLGACVGTAGFSWEKSGSRILPGAICEHLTSFGADFSHGGQTKLSEFLRFGAAGASGTVTEPFAIQLKFPHPAVQIHYAAGCSLAESFYQSVWGPYQLLVVGDPLARPFARFARVTLDAGSAPWKGVVRVSAASEPAAARMEFWLDGAPVPGEIDTAGLDDGVHELRAVAVAPGDVATRSFASALVTVANAGRAVEAQPPKSPPALGATFEVRGKAPGAEEVEVWRGATLLGRAAVKGTTFVVPVPTALLGPGPSELYVRARHAAPPSARSAPFVVEVADPEPPAPLAPPVGAKPQPSKAPSAWLPGLAGRSEAGTPIAAPGPAQSSAGGALAGELELPGPGRYQLVLPADRYTRILVAGRPVAIREGAHGLAFVPFAAAGGSIPIAFEGKLGGAAPLLSGDQVAQPARFRRPAPAAVGETPAAEGAFSELVDGKAIGKGLLLPAAGVELAFRKGGFEIAGILLHAAEPPRDAKERKPWPAALLVEYQDGGGKWRAVEKAAQVPCPSADAPGIPSYVEIDFKPVRSKRLRVKPQGEGAAVVTEIAVLARPK